ncbi:hypothetical protein AB1Y20_012458 [Prymnesium parvum]|uniref:Uncharacterized protein n=1 Tax=Prymnesium parvum TaxID=97485 RepID=A0AB34IKW6_PRYPA
MTIWRPARPQHALRRPQQPWPAVALRPPLRQLRLRRLRDASRACSPSPTLRPRRMCAPPNANANRDPSRPVLPRSAPAKAQPPRLAPPYGRRASSPRAALRSPRVVATTLALRLAPPSPRCAPSSPAPAAPPAGITPSRYPASLEAHTTYFSRPSTRPPPRVRSV